MRLSLSQNDNAGDVGFSDHGETWDDEEPQKDPLMVTDIAPKMRRKESSRPWLLHFLFVVGALLCLAILLPVYFKVIRKGDSDATTTTTTTTTTKENIGTAELVPSLRATVNELLGAELPSYTIKALDAIESPQSKALGWIMHDPNLDDYPAWRRKQRFALATLYFALDGTAWNSTTSVKISTETQSVGSTTEVTTTSTSTNGWLAYDKHECEWTKSNKDTTIVDNQEEEDLEVGGRRRLRFTETKSLCGAKKLAPGPGIQSRGGNNRRMMRMMARPMRNPMRAMQYYYSRGKGGKGGSMSKSKGRYYGSSSDSYDYYYYYRHLELEDTKNEPLIEDYEYWEPVQYLHLPENNMYGSLPPEMSLLTSVQSIDFSSNMLYGSLPTEIFGSMQLLTSLTLQDNSFSGSLPSQVGLWSNNLENNANALLEESPKSPNKGMRLNLAFNSLNQTLPSQLGLLTSLEELILAHNSFTGPMATSSFADLKSLRTLNLGDNSLTGPLWIGLLLAMEDLQGLFLHQNKLTGEVPAEIGLLTNLRFLELDNNMLRGSVPRQLRDLQQLDRLLLQSNTLEGPIPSELGSLQNVRVVGLSSNLLSSTIPSELGLMGSLQHLWLHENKLIGFVPNELGVLATSGKLELLDIHDNDLIGIIPDSLCGLSDIRFDCDENKEGRFLCGCDCGCKAEESDVLATYEASAVENPIEAQMSTPASESEGH